LNLFGFRTILIKQGKAFLFLVNSSGKTSNFLMEDLERILQLETIEKLKEIRHLTVRKFSFKKMVN